MALVACNAFASLSALMDIHLPTRPNIPLELLKYRTGWVLLRVGFIICLLLFLYLVRRISKAIRSHHHAIHLRKELIDNLRTDYLHHLQQLEGREFIVALLWYLERYGMTQGYASLEEMLAQLWVEQEKIQQTILLYYSKRGDEHHLAAYFKQHLANIM